MSGGAGHCQHKKIHLFLYKLYINFLLYFFIIHSNIIKYIYCCACKNFVQHCKKKKIITVHCTFFLSYYKVYCKNVYIPLSYHFHYVCITFFFLLYYILQSLYIYNHNFYLSNTNFLFIHFILICFF